MRKTGITRRRSSLSRSSSTASALTRKKKLLAARKPKARKPRKASETERIYGPKGRVAFVKSLGCVFCTMVSPVFGLVSAGQSHNAHTENGGMGRKASYLTIVPLCPSHHRLYDEHRAPLDMPELRAAIKSFAPQVEQRWQAHCAASTPSRSTTA